MLVYFDVQGRGQAIRYILDHHGHAFEDKRLTHEEWGPAKMAGTYTPVGGSLPAWISGGKKYTQSMAILSMLAQQFGKVPQTPEQVYEMNWYIETKKDHDDKKELMVAITQENADEETIAKFVANYAEMNTKCEERWNDGRKHVAGDQITMADYIYLAAYTCVRAN